MVRLPARACSRLHVLALSLERLQWRLRLELPESIVCRILAAAPIELAGEDTWEYAMMVQRRKRILSCLLVLQYFFAFLMILAALYSLPLLKWRT